MAERAVDGDKREAQIVLKSWMVLVLLILVGLLIDPLVNSIDLSRQSPRIHVIDYIGWR